VIKSRKLRWVGYVAFKGEMRNAYKIFVGKPEGKTPLWSPGPRWYINIKLGIGLEGVAWTEVVHKCSEFIEKLGDYQLPMKDSAYGVNLVKTCAFIHDIK
jgi:hypothetical protein